MANQARYEELVEYFDGDHELGQYTSDVHAWNSLRESHAEDAIELNGQCINELPIGWNMFKLLSITSKPFLCNIADAEMADISAGLQGISEQGIKGIIYNYLIGPSLCDVYLLINGNRHHIRTIHYFPFNDFPKRPFCSKHIYGQISWIIVWRNKPEDLIISARLGHTRVPLSDLHFNMPEWGLRNGDDGATILIDD